MIPQKYGEREMYTVLIILLLFISGILIYRGIKKNKSGPVISGVLLFFFTIFFFWFLDFWGNMLWFKSLGYNQRFWTLILSQTGFAVTGALFGWLVLFLLTLPVPKEKRLTRLISRGLGIFIGGIWGASNWEIILKFWHRVSSGFQDPILSRDTGFYLFSLPFLDQLYTLLLLLSLVIIGTIFTALFLRVSQEQLEIQLPQSDPITQKKLYQTLYLGSAFFIFILAFGKYLSRFHLLYSTWGAVTGPGWTDVHIRLPAYTVVILLTTLGGLILLIPPLRKPLERAVEKRTSRERIPVYMLGTVVLGIFILWFFILTIIPGLFQWLRVEPNEITFEEPYIENNIQMTRRGFRLHVVEEREYPAAERFNPEMVQQNQSIFSNIRLWDWRALDAVYKQFQEIRLYYEFKDVDIDRYTFSDEYRQVMVSARELELSNLPQQSQSFVNKRFKYTHGNGITLTTVREFTPDGLPNLLVKDIPPQSKYPELEVTTPQIYYGELTRSHVLANTREKELDYPSGEKNVYTHYQGKGGVVLKNIWRKFLFGWKFDGTRFFLSSYPTSQSRILFRREISERVKTLAPFLHFDDDPYIVLADGKLYWIIDGYTTSSQYPYSENFSSREIIEYKVGNQTRRLSINVGDYLDGVNYIRNSVKVVVDAYEGSVDFYVFDPEDPLIQVWERIFPDLFQKKSQMPPELVDHVRYPSDILLVQGLVYAKYHMSDPTVFYNQEDLWIRATEKYYNQVQPVEPYYVMWELPGSDEPQFVLILPFTPKNRQVLIGWIAGMCDPGNYGRFLAYKFPKEKRMLGPQQVETKIDQDRFLSGQLTLWDQRGSSVIRGNVLAIPIEKTLIYVEPIYIQAETAAYPELRLVAVMHGDNLSYAETFDQALKGLFEKAPEEAPSPKETVVPVDVPFEQLIQNANQAFEDYLRFQGEKQFEKAAQALLRLQEALKQLSQRSQSSES